MRRYRTLGLAGAGIMLGVAAIIWIISRTPAGDTAPGGVPPGQSQLAGRPVTYRVVLTEPALPPPDAMGPGGVTVDVADSAPEFYTVGRLYQLDASAYGDEQLPDWDTERALFVGTGESGTCPLGVAGVTVTDDGIIAVHVAPAESGPCTDDFRPRTFVLALEVADLPPGPLQVLVTGPGRAPSPVLTLPERIALAELEPGAECALHDKPEPGAGEQLVHVFQFCAAADDPAAVAAVPRIVPADREPLETALVELFAGPTVAERRAGYGSWFWYRTAPLLHRVEIADGVAIVDMGNINDYMNGASTSAGSAGLFAQLNNTVFQFPDVTAVEYRLNGSCDEFFSWLQRGCQLIPATGYR